MDAYSSQYESLTDAQRAAVDWDDGSLLVLAGPGSGKTRVLTSRIARILRNSPDKAFRVLALTFTNKAADEMQSRLQTLCEGGEERALVGTFHSFCMQILQQHGSHIGIAHDFTIYSLDQDRREILKDAIRKHGLPEATDDASATKHLQLIDKLKANLINPDVAASKFKDAEQGRQIGAIYQAYEAELHANNVLDFNSLILRAHQLIGQFDGIAARYRKSYRYWLFDEFQDTNRAQYKFLKTLAGDSFKNIFVVADDDQIIYQWNGASFQQLQRFRADFGPELIQLPTNWRCPPAIVSIANNLVRHNLTRTESKLPLEAGKLQTVVPQSHSILMGAYATDQDEASAVAEMIASRSADSWNETAVIGRSKAVLENFKNALQTRGVAVSMAQRRDEFVSPQYGWLHSILKQVIRQQDRRNFDHMISSFNRWKGTTYSSEIIASLSLASSRSLLDEWLFNMSYDPNPESADLVGRIKSVASDSAAYAEFVAHVIKSFDAENADPDSDLGEDSRAWKSLYRSITSAYGRNLALDQFLQHMALQSKEPPIPAQTVTLMTVHAAKGKEFDYVHVVGLAEEVMPSYQSLKAGGDSQEMEEERRNCFVAITRTKEQLILTRAARYRGYAKKPSRFLAEMGFSVS